MSELKAVLDRLTFGDDAKVQSQLAGQIQRVNERLARVRRKILVLSGKGGVGKSTVSAQLALALARAGLQTGLLDADLNGPSIPRMLGLSGSRLELDASGARPVTGPDGVLVASMSFLLEAQNPLRWNGPMHLSPIWLGAVEAGVLREFLSDVAWGELDILLFDLPPGAAADKPPALANLIPDLEGAVVVTTGSWVAAEVVRKSILYARDLGIPILGLVENMCPEACPHCGAALEEKSPAVAALAEEFGLPILARIPRSGELLRSCDQGSPLPREHPVSRIFQELAQRLISAKPAAQKTLPPVPHGEEP